MTERMGGQVVRPGSGRSLAPRGEELAPGDLIDGRYLVEALLGRGGMGTVVRARDVDLGRSVAIKTIRRDLSDDHEISACFRHEARALAALRSPHVVPIHAFGRHRGDVFFVMDHVEGDSLAAVLDRHVEQGSRMALEQALEVLEGIAAGLDDVHAAGLQHRDVKPENVILERATGRPILIDLGLVTRGPAASGASASVDVGPGRHGGTPGYMAPELCLGRGPVGAAADVYAFGCTIFEVLTGRQVFVAPTIDELMTRHAVSTPPWPSSIRGELAPIDGILAKALAKDPAERPPSCGGVARAIRRELSSAAIVERFFRPGSDRPDRPAAAARSDGLQVIIVDTDPLEARLVSRAAAFVFSGRRLDVRVVDDACKLLPLAAGRPADLMVVDLDASGAALVEVLLALRMLHPRERLRVVVRADLPPAAVAERLAAFGPVDVLPRQVPIAMIMRFLEAIALREGLIAPHGDRRLDAAATRGGARGM